MPKPTTESYPPYFEKYISLVPQDDCVTGLLAQQPLIDEFFQNIPLQKQTYAYAPGKWTLKEMLLHLIDTERIFCFRALCFARGEQQNIPGFDEDAYAANSNANGRSWASLCQELQAVRQATLFLFQSFTESQLQAIGMANQKSVNVNAIGFMCIGHIYHHVAVAKERYLS